MLYAVLVHHILAEGVQNNRQAPYRAPTYFLSSSQRGKAPRITPSFPGAGTGRARGFNVLDDAARHGSHIGAAVTADFGFIVQTAQRHAYLLKEVKADRACVDYEF